MPAESAARRSAVRNLAVFIDADNLCDPTALDHVLTDLRQRAERVLYKRAYGRPESLKAIEMVLGRHAVRPVANMVVGKVTTDVALVIDAVEAVCANDIDAVALCSGDADFVPLAIWLREKGCQVWCFALAKNVFASAANFYDDVVLIELVESQPSVVPSTPVKPPPSAPEPAISPVPAPAPMQPTTKVELATSMPEGLARALQLVPDLRHEAQSLSMIVPKLKQVGLIDKTPGAGAKWFRQWPEWIVLTPPKQPNQVAITPKARKLVQTPAGAAKAAPPSSPKPQGQAPAKMPQTPDLPHLRVLSEPLAKRTMAQPLPPHLHALRHVLHEVRYLKVTPLQVLQTAPELVSGARFTLGSVGARLRARGLIDPAHSALRVLRHMERSFEVQTENPQWVRYRG